MRLICTQHLEADAVARCVACGDHLCRDCRTRIGVRNYCKSCQSGQRVARSFATPAPAHPAAVAGIHVASGTEATAAATALARRRRKSPTIAAALSLLPGLGQAYSGSILRGVLFFVAFQALRDWSGLTPLVGYFLYTFNLWDAYRLTEKRTTVQNGGTVRKLDRFEEGLVTLTGLGVVGYTLLQMGGLAAATSAAVVPLAAVAAGLLIAQETRN